MPRSGRMAVMALGGVAFLASRREAFLPAPGASTSLWRAGMVAAPAAGMMVMEPAAFADQIADASAKFSDAAYPIAQKINWGNTPEIARYIAEESAKNPKGVAAAVDKLLEAGLTMDPALVKAAVKAHEVAIRGAADKPNLVASKADFAAVNEALARMIVSADKEKFFYFLTAFPENKELQMQLFGKNNDGQAKKAYDFFVGLTDAVCGASTNGATPFETKAATGGAIGDASAKFSDATYGLIGHYFLTRDFSSYVEVQEQVDKTYADKARWASLSVLAALCMPRSPRTA